MFLVLPLAGLRAALASVPPPLCKPFILLLTGMADSRDGSLLESELPAKAGVTPKEFEQLRDQLAPLFELKGGGKTRLRWTHPLTAAMCAAAVPVVRAKGSGQQDAGYTDAIASLKALGLTPHDARAWLDSYWWAEPKMRDRIAEVLYQARLNPPADPLSWLNRAMEQPPTVKRMEDIRYEG